MCTIDEYKKRKKNPVDKGYNDFVDSGIGLLFIYRMSNGMHQIYPFQNVELNFDVIISYQSIIHVYGQKVEAPLGGFQSQLFYVAHIAGYTDRKLSNLRNLYTLGLENASGRLCNV